MRRMLALLTMVALGVAPMAARAEGEIEDPVEPEPFSCSITVMMATTADPFQPCEDVALVPGEHALTLGWSAGTTANVFVDVAGEAGSVYVLRCAVRAGSPSCAVDSTVAHAYHFVNAGPAGTSSGYQTAIQLPEGAVLSFMVGTGRLHDGCTAVCTSLSAGLGTVTLDGM